MKLLTLWAALLFMAIAGTTQADTRYVYSAGDGFLNLRTGPSTDYEIIKPMYNGQRVWVITRKGNWQQVRHESGTVGWAYQSYLIAQPVMEGGRYYVNSPGDGYLNLRTGPSGSAAIIRQMPHGSSLNVTGHVGKWLSVVHQSGAQGWAFHRYLSSTRPPVYDLNAIQTGCSAGGESNLAWYIRSYKCGSKSVAEYPSCVSRWTRKLCQNVDSPSQVMNRLMAD
ncbi:MAG: SH3 domain-containing protein [Roseovarius sp.]